MKIPTFTVSRVPQSVSDGGSIGNIAYTNNYLYIYTHKGWKHVAFSKTRAEVPTTVFQNHNMEGYAFATFDNFFLYVNGAWRTFGIEAIDDRLITRGGSPFLVIPIYQYRLSLASSITSATCGAEGMVSYNSDNFYIYSAGVWRMSALSSVTPEIIPVLGSPPAGVPEIIVNQI